MSINGEINGGKHCKKKTHKKPSDVGSVKLCKSVFAVVFLIVNLFILCVGTFLHFDI